LLLLNKVDDGRLVSEAEGSIHQINLILSLSLSWACDIHLSHSETWLIPRCAITRKQMPRNDDDDEEKEESDDEEEEVEVKDESWGSGNDNDEGDNGADGNSGVEHSESVERLLLLLLLLLLLSSSLSYLMISLRSPSFWADAPFARPSLPLTSIIESLTKLLDSPALLLYSSLTILLTLLSIELSFFFLRLLAWDGDEDRPYEVNDDGICDDDVNSY